MARSYAQLLVAIWDDDDYRALTVGGQWAYQMLISQRDLNYCGVVPYRLRRWSKFTASLTAEDVADAIEELAAAGYVVVDEDTEELWVRSFMKHNKILEQTQLRGAAKAAYEAIASGTIRSLVYHSTPDELRGHLTDKSPGPKPGRQGGEQGGEQALGTGTCTSDLEPEPSSSTAPESADLNDRVLRSIEEEDAYYVEAQRRTRIYAKTHEIISPRRILETFTADVWRDYPDRPPSGLRLMRADCGNPLCINGWLEDPDDSTKVVECECRRTA